VPDVDVTRFDRSLVSDLDEPVQRFFTHAIRDGAALGGGVRLRMTGRIKVGTWLPFSAEQIADGRSFAWRARVGWGPIAPLRVVDRYADGAPASRKADCSAASRSFMLTTSTPHARPRLALRWRALCSRRPACYPPAA
jgi:hypothetical protein